MNQGSGISTVGQTELSLPNSEFLVSSTFGHPDEVLSHPDMTTAQKRTVLASWMSDARAVENAPSLRQIDSGAVVTINVIQQAFKSLDESEGPLDVPASKPLASSRGRLMPRWLKQAIRLNRFEHDDDDDPPPCPASAAVPLKLLFVEADSRRAGTDARRPAIAGHRF